MIDPIEKFNHWWTDALQDTPLKQKSAVCVSTISEAGFPQARFVDLKSASREGFTFCSYFDSAKGRDIEWNPKVALTAWWDHVGYQVRVVGVAEKILEAQANKFWLARNRSAQLTTTCFEQSEPLASEAELVQRFEDTQKRFADQDVPKPANWGGFIVKPITIEFLTFNDTRLHLRERFLQEDSQWRKQLLQP